MIKNVTTHMLLAVIPPEIATARGLDPHKKALIYLHTATVQEPPAPELLAQFATDEEYDCSPESVEFLEELPLEQWKNKYKRARFYEMERDGYTIHGSAEYILQRPQNN